MFIYKLFVYEIDIDIKNFSKGVSLKPYQVIWDKNLARYQRGHKDST